MAETDNEQLKVNINGGIFPIWWLRKKSGITTDLLNDKVVTTEKLADGAVTEGKLAEDVKSILGSKTTKTYVDSELAKKVGNGVLAGTDDLESEAVTGPKLASNAVTTGKIAPNTILADDINANAFDDTLAVTRKLADAKVVGDRLALKADKATTYTKSEVDNAVQTLDDELNGKINAKQQDIKAIYVHEDSLITSLADSMIVVHDGNVQVATIFPVAETDDTIGVIYQFEDEWRVVTSSVSISGKTWNQLLNAFDDNSRKLSDKGMSDEQAAQLKKLMDKTFPLSASASISPTGLQEKGTLINVTISAIKAMVDGEEQARTQTTINGIAIAGDTMSYKGVSDSTNYTVKVKIADGREATVTKSVTFVNPTYAGFGLTAASVMSANNKKLVTSAKGTYAATNATGSAAKYIILVPSGVTAPTNFMMGGAPYVMNTSTQVINGVSYTVLTSGGTYANGGSVNIVAS